MKKNIKYRVYIKDISDAEEKGLKAIIPALNGAIVYGADLREIEKGIILSIEYQEKFGKKEKFIIKDVDDYDYIIEDISNNKNDPAFEAYIPKLKTKVYGANFIEIEKGIIMAYECEEKTSKHLLKKSRLAIA
jgi:hypothetical protein